MIPGRIIEFDENKGYGYVKLLDNPMYLDYKEMWFRYLDVQGDMVKRGDTVHVWVSDKLGVEYVQRVEKV